MRRHHALLAAQLRHTLAQLVHPPIHLADARVDGGQYTCDATFAITSLRKRRERRDRHHRQVGAVRDTLAPTRGNAQTRERTGATSEGDGIELCRLDVGLAQQIIHHRKDQPRVFTRRECIACGDCAVEIERGRTGRGGGVDGEQVHIVRSAMMDSVCSAVSVSVSKKRCTSPIARLRVISGRLYRKTLPKGFDSRRGSHSINTPRSCTSRIKRPTPCFKVITACGNCASRKGSPPRLRNASSRACNTGSPGAANGSLSMITTDKASPRTSTPSQNLLVPSSTALPRVRKRCSRSRRGAVPCINSGKGN